jgi:hypothetical protein
MQAEATPCTVPRVWLCTSCITVFLSGFFFDDASAIRHKESFEQQMLIYEIMKAYVSYVGSRVSSGSIVSDYGLDDRAIEVRSPAGARDFSCSFCVQTGSEAHPASCTMGTGGPFPGGKARPGRDADHSPPI